MVALQIREVPEEIRAKLAAIARERGQSLQNYLFDVVSDEVRRHDNLAAVQRLTGRFNAHLGTDDIVETLHEARAQRDVAFGLPGGDDQ